MDEKKDRGCVIESEKLLKYALCNVLNELSKVLKQLEKNPLNYQLTLKKDALEYDCLAIKELQEKQK